MMPALSIAAPAKINLALHVVGRRADGFHLLDMLVAFAEVGDTVRAEPATGLSLSRAGPFAADLGSVEDDLVLKAARALADLAGIDTGARGAALHLEKNLPVASGIGGGSADAAAALTALTRLWQTDLAPAEIGRLALSLGADVPMCLAGVPARVTGIGEGVAPYSGLPDFSFVVVNPGVAVSTPAVFRALSERENPPLPDLPPAFGSAADLVLWLGETRNDLEAPAISIAPEIADVLSALRQARGCLFSRMSGSGATCVAIFATLEEAAAAADKIATGAPGWWVSAARARTSRASG
ncbi:MAG: 4-(cytidine 5'-diphospho)-2-C-methyl-D-erythritol kinase [Hyphomicrobiales bacterium]